MEGEKSAADAGLEMGGDQVKPIVNKGLAYVFKNGRDTFPAKAYF